MEISEILQYVRDNIYPIISALACAFLTGILSSVAYQLKGCITVITKYIPMAMQSAERNFPNGHGDFKQDYVLNFVKNKCNAKKIKFRKKLFTFMVKLYVRMSKVINNTVHVYTEEELNEEDKK